MSSKGLSFSAPLNFSPFMTLNRTKVTSGHLSLMVMLVSDFKRPEAHSPAGKPGAHSHVKKTS